MADVAPGAAEEVAEAGPIPAEAEDFSIFREGRTENEKSVNGSFTGNYGPG